MHTLDGSQVGCRHRSALSQGGARVTAPHTAMRGFTLLELMVVVVVIGILSTIAYSSYKSHVIKTRRSAAAACLMEKAQMMERVHTMQMSYLDSTGGAPDIGGCDDSISDYYTVAITSVAAKTFALTATAQGTQATDDTQCGNLSIDHKGLRSISGSGTVKECW